MRMLIAKVQVARGWRKVARAERRAIEATWPRWRRWTHRTLLGLGEMVWIFLGMVIPTWMAWAQIESNLLGGL